MEGLGSFVAGVIGNGVGTTSYSQNVGLVSLTKVILIYTYISVLLMLLLYVCFSLANTFIYFFLFLEPLNN